MSNHNNGRPRPSRIPRNNRRVEIEEWREALLADEGTLLANIDEMTARHLAGRPL
jgi:hypothetical protein